MQVAIIGDIHLGASFAFGRPETESGINSRLLDYEKTLDKIITYIIENNIKLCIMLGDIFETRNPSPQQIIIFYRQLKRLSRAGITTYILMGNHDYIKTRKITSSLDPFKEIKLPNISVYTDIKLMTFNDGNEQLNVMLMPYRNRQSYDKSLNEEAIIELANELNQAKSTALPNVPTLLCGHMMMEGTIPADANEYGINELILPFNIFDGIDMVINGHIHRASVLKEYPTFIYSGSMECKDFSEKDHKKVFLIYDSNKSGVNSITFKPIETRQFTDFDIDYSVNVPDEPMQEILDKIRNTNIKNAVVKMQVRIIETKLTTIDEHLIRKTLYEAGANYISNISISPVISKQLRNQKINEAPDDISAFKHYCASQLNLQDNVVQLGLAIIANNNEV